MNQRAKIIIATRQSTLALKQTQIVQNALLNKYPNLRIEILGITTSGDRFLDRNLNQIGGKGLFVKELEQALLEGKADIAIHSMKDMPVEIPNELCLPVICVREQPEDVLVSLNYKSLEDLPYGSVIGTTSLRRKSQLLSKRPDLKIMPLRGNINTRLDKLSVGNFDAIILAKAGLLRLGRSEIITQSFDPTDFIPAAGQGAIVIECRKNDPLISLISFLDDHSTHLCVTAERNFNLRLQGGCQTPIGAYARMINENLELHGFVGDPLGKRNIKDRLQMKIGSSIDIGKQLAEQLLAKGAQSILDSLKEIM